MHETTYSAFLDELQKLGASKGRLNISKSRTGTRPISVANLLKKDNAGTLHKKAGLGELLKTPIPGTKDWFVNTGKQGLQGALKTTARSGARAAGTVTKGGVTSIGEGELKRMGFGSLSKTGGASSEASKSDDVKYKLHGHTVFQGLQIAIENRKGSVRKGVDPDGKPWKTTFEMPYGYFKKTEGKDGEEIDAYVGPKTDATHAYVVHQQKLDGSGHDEDKVMLGQPSEAAARQAYLKHYNKVGPKLLGDITAIPMDRLKAVLSKADGKRISKLAEPTIGMPDSSMEYTPERKKRGDVPSRDGTDVGGMAAKTEDGRDNVTTLPTGYAQSSSATGAMP